MSENVTPEQWARYIARDLGADFLPTQIGDSLSSTKRKADAYDALGPNPEAAVKGAREAMKTMLDWIENDCPDVKGNQYGRLGIATGAMMLALAALGGGK